MFTVLVKWTDAPRAERLDARGGTTTQRKFHATAFPTRDEAERVAARCMDGIAGIEWWRVAPF
jgi:hypothetical protein